MTLALVLCPAALPAAMIRTVATGEIQECYDYGGDLCPFVFHVGESVTLDFVYETRPADEQWVLLSLDFTTSGGWWTSYSSDDFNFSGAIAHDDAGQPTGLFAAVPDSSVYMGISSGLAFVNYGRDDGTGTAGHGFRAPLTITAVEGPPITAPEPDGLTLGLLGAVGVVLAMARKAGPWSS